MVENVEILKCFLRDLLSISRYSEQSFKWTFRLATLSWVSDLPVSKLPVGKMSLANLGLDLVVKNPDCFRSISARRQHVYVAFENSFVSHRFVRRRMRVVRLRSLFDVGRRPLCSIFALLEVCTIVAAPRKIAVLSVGLFSS